MTAQDNHKVLKCNNMDDTQLILTALSQVPDLVAAARTYKDVNDKAINTISTAVKQQPKAIIPDSDINHEHTHRHHSIAGFWNIVNDVAKKWIIGLGIFSVVSIGAFAYWVHYVRNSELFLGQRCLEIYESEYVTDQEKKEMFKDFYSVALCPKKYKDSPQALRERIRKNEAIIYEREVQSCFKKGKFKTDKKVGF